MILYNINSLWFFFYVCMNAELMHYTDCVPDVSNFFISILLMLPSYGQQQKTGVKI